MYCYCPTFVERDVDTILQVIRILANYGFLLVLAGAILLFATMGGVIVFIIYERNFVHPNQRGLKRAVKHS
jgi:hypothetical protein